MNINKKIGLICLLLVLGIFVVGFVKAAATGLTDAVYMNVTLINQRPDPVEPGEYVELRFKFENYGSANAEDVEVEILPKYPFTLDEGESAIKKIGSINGRQISDYGVTVKYKLKVDEGAVEGENEIELRFKVKDQFGIGAWQKPDPFVIDVQTRDAILAVDSVVLEPAQIAPGSTALLKITIKNMADSMLKHVKTKLDVLSRITTTTTVTTNELPLAPIGSTNEKTLYNLAPKENVTIEFELIADPNAESKIYKLPLILEYQDELGKNYTKTYYTSIVLGETPDLAVEIDSSEIYKSGGVGTITIKFVNKGTSDIKFLYSVLEESKEFEIISSANIYVGNIDSDDYETAEYKIYVKPTRKDSVVLPLSLEHKDANNKDYIKKINLELKLYSAREAKRYGLVQGSKSVGIFIFVVIVVGGYFFYRRWRKKKRKKRG